MAWISGITLLVATPTPIRDVSGDTGGTTVQRRSMGFFQRLRHEAMRPIYGPRCSRCIVAILNALASQKGEGARAVCPRRVTEQARNSIEGRSGTVRRATNANGGLQPRAPDIEAQTGRLPLFRSRRVRLGRVEAELQILSRKVDRALEVGACSRGDEVAVDDMGDAFAEFELERQPVEISLSDQQIARDLDRSALTAAEGLFQIDREPPCSKSSVAEPASSATAKIGETPAVRIANAAFPFPVSAGQPKSENAAPKSAPASSPRASSRRLCSTHASRISPVSLPP